MNCLHGQNILHRDLKPANILLKKNDNAERPFIAKIIDFGFHRIVELNKYQFTDVRSAGYSAPEIDENIGHSLPVDIYALGIIYKQLLGQGE